MDWKPVQEAFPVNRELIWLNNCGTTPAGSFVLEAMDRYLKAYSLHGLLTPLYSYRGVLEKLKRSLSDLIGCDADEVTLVHNTWEGMQSLSLGLSLEKGDEILILDQEYPSNVYPWEHWRNNGVRLRFAPLAETPELQGERILESLTSRTRVAALSLVHWGTGCPLPMESLGKELSSRGVELIVDGAQGVGMVPVDVHGMEITAMAFPAWKWLLGPLGLGVLFLRRDKMSSFRLPFKGTGSVVRDEQYLPYRDEVKESADRYIYSTPNFNDWIYFQASLDFLGSIGFQDVRSRIFQLASLLAHGLAKKGFRLASTAAQLGSTGIVSAKPPMGDAASLVSRLRQHGVVAAERMGHLRFAPHVYISEDQIKKVLSLLPGTARG